MKKECLTQRTVEKLRKELKIFWPELTPDQAQAWLDDPDALRRICYHADQVLVAEEEAEEE